MPPDECLIFQRNVESAEPLPYGVDLTAITAGYSLVQILNRRILQCMGHIIGFDLNVPAQRIQGADSGFRIVDCTLPVFQEGTALDMANGLQSDDWNVGMLANVAFAVFMVA